MIYSFHHHLGSNQRVYTFEDAEWMAKGRYEFAVRNDEEVIWSKVEEDHITLILIVGVFKNYQVIFLIFWIFLEHL